MITVESTVLFCSFCLVKKTLVKKQGLGLLLMLAHEKKFYLFHQTFVSNLSGPCRATAALKFVVLTDCSEFG